MKFYWLRKSCKPQKGQFGYRCIEKNLSITALVRDAWDVHWYYHLTESEIPVQESNIDVVTKFVKSLLILRNVLLVNRSLVFNAVPNNNKRSESSKTVSSPKSCRPRY